ncbi:hypothetical protein DDB_G0278897 [Dictyostelium discoideum AX4]|uniref:RGS domain-containing protein n=1 Tax=Dictyostelium discoideum TaxID=44689 RepID=Q54XJ6_DICDI|nr:hypothetical protein DDB_G0278897 [Dictyostelium discoideum AX4]EAL68050.1 hypothetical protein DDB_G0278897 [Dictyostelium discoideum AX4]|eukprot:XP_647807.1 hypothetical protein DDB_G0278897 [Dictyostelium discoideum AX4]
MIYPNDVMNEVLRDEIGCDLFRNYLKTIYCSETLQFWTEIEAFKAFAPPPKTENNGTLLAFSSTPIESSSSSSNNNNNTSSNNNNNNGGCFSSNNNNSKQDNTKYLPQDELHEKAQNLFDRFLENGSEFELNIDALSREVVRTKLSDDIDSSLFDDVQKVVYESLWMDCFPPFTHTLAYNRYKQDTGKCHLPEFLRISFKRKSPKKDDNIRMKPISK